MKINIETEEQSGAGWIFGADVAAQRGESRRFRIRLSWMDYNLWSPDGVDRPEEVAQAALRFLLAREPAAEIAPEFDAARIRRRYADADVEIPRLIRRG